MAKTEFQKYESIFAKLKPITPNAKKENKTNAKNKNIKNKG